MRIIMGFRPEFGEVLPEFVMAVNDDVEQDVLDTLVRLNNLRPEDDRFHFHSAAPDTLKWVAMRVLADDAVDFDREARSVFGEDIR